MDCQHEDPIMPDEQIAALERQHAHLRSQFASIGEMRSGSLTERFRPCGKPRCHCAKPGDPGHGPVLSLTRKQAGKTVTRIIPAHAGSETQARLAEYRRFRQLSKMFIKVNDALSEARLATGSAAKKKPQTAVIAKSLAAEATREIERLLGADATQTLGDFEAAETAVRTAVLAVAARFVAERLNADHSDQHAAGLPCRCGHTARYAGRRAKTIRTALGAMTLQRAYYHCASCRTGFCPRDRTLGIDETTLSPAATRMTAAAAARVSFKEASTLLDELAGLAVDPKQVERTAEALGRAIATDERQAVEPEAHRVKPTLYLGMDGTGIPVRKAETAQRQGKQPDGSAKTREVKLAVAWTAERRHPKTGIPMRDPDSVSYTAAIETAASRDTDREPSPFAQRVCREAERRRFADADRRVILGDGAPWIWALADECFPDAIQIVDIFHAKSHLWDVAKAIYTPGSELAAQWAKQRRDELDAGRISALVAALAHHAPTCDEARKCIDYLIRNRKRMRYPAFRARGLCVATGIVEAGCKHAVGARLKRAGMHWSVNGANAILALRCCILSGRFEAFWERRNAAA